jgi:hypothetical protein
VVRSTPPLVAFGPELPGWGSWQWVGADLLAALDGPYRVVPFQNDRVPDCDLVFLVKHALPPDLLASLARRSALVYAPIDFYGSGADIDADGPALRRCARVVVHCERLRRYFEPYAPVEYLDHHVKFAPPPRAAYRAAGPLLWVGVRTNLPPLVEWVNRFPLPSELVVLTNPEVPGQLPTPAQVGFRGDRAVRMAEWSPEGQLDWTQECRAALDIKGDDFRSRHKPPAKAIDFLASGIPLAMNAGSSPVEHLARLGFDVASPLDMDYWLSREYWEETQRFGAALRELLSLPHVARRCRRILDAVLAERAGR